MSEVADWRRCFDAIGHSAEQCGLGLFPDPLRVWELSASLEESFHWVRPDAGIDVAGEYCPESSDVRIGAVFLFGRGEPGIAEYPGALPFGVRFGDSRETLLQKLPAAEQGDCADGSTGTNAGWVSAKMEHGKKMTVRLSSTGVAAVVSFHSVQRTDVPSRGAPQAEEWTPDPHFDIGMRDVLRDGVGRTIDRLGALCEERVDARLRPEAAARLFALLETLECLPLDEHGGVVVTLEAWSEQHPELIRRLLRESLLRRPTIATVEMAIRRLYRHRRERKGWLNALASVASHQGAMSNVRQLATDEIAVFLTDGSHG